MEVCVCNHYYMHYQCTFRSLLSSQLKLYFYSVYAISFPLISFIFYQFIQGGKKELMRESQLRREDLGKRAETDVREVRTHFI